MATCQRIALPTTSPAMGLAVASRNDRINVLNATNVRRPHEGTTRAPRSRSTGWHRGVQVDREGELPAGLHAAWIPDHQIERLDTGTEAAGFANHDEGPLANATK